MNSFKGSVSFNRRQVFAIAAILLLVQLWAGFTFANRSLDQANNAAEEDMTRRAARTIDQVERELYSYLPAVRGVAAHFAVTDTPAPDEFGQLIDELDIFESHESVGFLTWVERVDLDGVDDFIADAQAAGRTDFVVPILNPDAEWHAITVDGASREGQLPLGADVTFDEGVERGLTVSADTRQPALAQLTSTDAQDESNETSREFVEANELMLSYLLVVPVAYPDAPAGDPLKGWVIAQLAVPTGAAVVSDGLLPFDVGIVTDGRVRRTHSSGQSLRTQADEANRWEQRVAMGDVVWEVRAWASPDDTNWPVDHREREIWMFTAGIMLFTVLGAMIVGGSVRSNDQLSSALSVSHTRLRRDSLTGAMNRLGVTELLATMSSDGEYPTVVFCDVDNFKRVNDSLGHDAGDELLRVLAARLIRLVGEDGAVARFGGDEFVIVTNSDVDSENALELAESVRRVTDEPFSINGGLIETTISVGFTASEGDRDAGALLRDADAAMYRAKRDGGDRTSAFDERLRAEVSDRLAIEQALRTAATDGSLHCAYQTLHRSNDLSVWGVEALVRWNRPGVGIVSPGVFLPIAEESAQVLDIGGWVIEEACRFGVSLRNQIPDAVMTANLSVRQLGDPELIPRVVAALEVSGLDPSALCLEINEDALVDSGTQLATTLNDLKRVGVQLALDDFGSGRTSLTHLAELNMLDIVKLDRQFVTSLVDNEVEQAIVKAVITIARAADMEVVVEGVETEEQSQILISLGVDLLQGFHLSRPAPANSDELAAVLAARSVTA